MKNINKTSIIIALASLVLGVAIGGVLFSSSASNGQHDHISEEVTEEVWTCSMHPQIRKNEEGECPICGMDLIPLGTSEASDENPMEIKMSPTAMQLANVQTQIVKKEKPIKKIRLNGKVQVNESTVSSQTSHISGRIERLLINTTGEFVTKGQIVAFVYSPELISAQKELFEAQKFKSSNPELFNAVKEKLRNWKLTNKQIDAILISGKPSEHFPILADISGVVTSKRVNVGDYIKTGASLFEIADLSKVWILFDIYEIDMEWVKVGDEIEYNVQSISGSTFKGKVSFIDPVINPKTRVAKARLVVNNRVGLKPEMFVKGILSNPINESEESIVIPKTAVMWTGEKSVVYVKTSEINGVNFMMRKVDLGASLGDSFVVLSGLEEGEEVATNGTFSIDASAQLAGKPSMMNPEGGIVMTGHNHGSDNINNAHENHSSKVSISKEVKASLEPLINSYIKLKNALVKNDHKGAIKEAKVFESELAKINMSIFKGEAHNVWMKHSSEVKKAIYALSKSNNMENTRMHFVALSQQMVMIVKTFEPAEKTLYVQHCPMANQDNGADWISTEQEIKNPYFGEAMLKCGEVKTTIK